MWGGRPLAFWVFPRPPPGPRRGRTGDSGRQHAPPQSAHRLCLMHPMQQATCQFARLPYSALASILHGNTGGAVRMMSMMYQAYQNHMDLTAPWRNGAASALKYLNLVPQGVSDRLFGRLPAALELISRTSLPYTRPPYGIDTVLVGNRELRLTEAVTSATPF